ncbi:MAG: hypothetical protein U9R15_04205 [Chloroflexota bacterium]|nr:hypothetical protein [Chloroflexota bacterium]
MKMTAPPDYSWPIFVQDRRGREIYLTWERWEHALEHPGMCEELLDWLLEALRKSRRKQDPYDPTKFKYTCRVPDLPMSYTHIVVVVKFGWQVNSSETNNFVLTAYLIEKW